MLTVTPPGSPPAPAPAPGGGLIRWPDVQTLTGLSRSTVDRLERAGSFPRRVLLSENAVGWRKAEILAWAQSREVRQ